MTYVGAMQNMEIKNSDDTIRDAAYLQVQLADANLKQSEVIRVLCTCRVL